MGNKPDQEALPLDWVLVQSQVQERAANDPNRAMLRQTVHVDKSELVAALRRLSGTKISPTGKEKARFFQQDGYFVLEIPTIRQSEVHREKVPASGNWSVVISVPAWYINFLSNAPLYGDPVEITYCLGDKSLDFGQVRVQVKQESTQEQKQLPTPRPAPILLFPIPPPISDQEHLLKVVTQDIEAFESEHTYREGAISQVLINKYERNAELRAAAIRIHGTNCQVCGFSFQEFYGPHGSDYIEVHHLRPISTYGREINVDPAKDMAVLCANCHRMIHRKAEAALSLDELRLLVCKPNL